MVVIFTIRGNPDTKSRIPQKKRELCLLELMVEHINSKMLSSLANLSGFPLVAGFENKCSNGCHSSQTWWTLL